MGRGKELMKNQKMKQLAIFFSVILLLFTSCSKNIEKIATKRMAAMMKERVYQPDKASIVNIQTEYKCDSLCILAFTLKAPNGYGQMMSSPMEYIYVDADIAGQHICAETATDFSKSTLDDKTAQQSADYKQTALQFAAAGYNLEYILSHSVQDVKAKYRQSLMKGINLKDGNSDLEGKLNFSAAWLKLLANGRVVSPEDGKSIKL
jgi:hypothetical protein